MEMTPLSVPGPPPRRTSAPVIGVRPVPFTANFGPETDGQLPPAGRCGSQASRARADHAGMLIGLVFLALVATVPLAGGRVGALAELRFRAKGLLVGAIVAQILIVSIFPDGSATLHNTVHIATYVVVAVFVVANRRIPWVWLVALGG